MAHVLGDMVHETSTTTGTGAYSLGGAVANRFAFSRWLNDGDTTDYVATDGVDFESGIGTFDITANTLARTQIKRSTNGDSAVNWGAGTRDILIAPLGSRLIAILDQNLGNGLVVKKALDDWIVRAIAAGTHVSVADGDGLLGNPTITVTTGTSGTKIPVLDTGVTWTSQVHRIEKGGLGVGQLGPVLEMERREQGVTKACIVRFRAENEDSALFTASEMFLFVNSDTVGSEDADLRFGTMRNGTFVDDRMTLGAGLQVGSPAGGDKGAGKINAEEIYENNVRVQAQPPQVEFIAAITATNDATVEFTGFDASKFKIYIVFFENIVPGTDSVDFQMRTSSDGGSSFDSGASDYRYVSRGRTDDNTGVGEFSNGASEIQLNTNALLGNASGEAFNGILEIYAPDVAQTTQFTWRLSYIRDNGGLIASYGSGARLSSGTVNGLQWFMSSGNVGSGVFRIYGIRKS